MANCLSDCPTDIVIDAGAFRATGPANGFFSHTFTWTIPAGLNIASSHFNVEWTVDGGIVTSRYSGFPVAFLFTNQAPGSYSTTFSTPAHVTGAVAAGATISTTLQFFGDGISAFDVTVTCFTCVLSLVCAKPLINLGTGDIVTLCTSAETHITVTQALLPQWIRDSNKTWAILDDQDNLINSSATPLNYPRYTPHPAPPCNFCTIEAACSPLTYAKSPPGSYVIGPLRAERLTDVHQDPTSGWQYTIQTCSHFIIVVDHKCAGVIEPPPPPPPPPPDKGKHAAIEQDGPRRWIHVGIGKKIQSYDSDYNPIWSGDFPVDAWHKFRCDPRLGTLAALGRKDSAGADGTVTGSTFSMWVSTDGGQTANKVGEMAASSSLLERDSERGWHLWFTADGSNNVSVQISKDGGQTYDDPVDVNLDDGTRLQGTIMDSCQDCRSGGRVAMVISPGSDPAAAPTSTAIVVSDDGGLTFRKVV